MPWVTRGLRNGRLTTRYPARTDGYGEGWRGGVVARQTTPRSAITGVAEICPPVLSSQDQTGRLQSTEASASSAVGV